MHEYKWGPWLLCYLQHVTWLSWNKQQCSNMRHLQCADTKLQQPKAQHPSVSISFFHIWVLRCTINHYNHGNTTNCWLIYLSWLETGGAGILVEFLPGDKTHLCKVCHKFWWTLLLTNHTLTLLKNSGERRCKALSSNPKDWLQSCSGLIKWPAKG